ncbi:serine threonine- kinase CTR1-like isoform X1 [Chlorella sorokiniana]|uniref:Serine threonine-kinase CTR1-like isoform X1 n=1 Tax=Chlorella sorokiniana TaxID=3076 RepID=A0A2P6TR69_CHLSO|nr:serine threonine- kinase CTR1-like isoform X1 [Chlorella sorokiniana]|eukprot:PRW56562.1 serine threonine- kinase CTR1-like isoform X1 [Chlorella sorokiniana]
MRRRQRRAGTAAVAAALLLRLGLAAAGWVDVAFTLPPDLLGPSTYRPISWTAEQVDGMRRRALLQQAAGGGPSLGGSGGKLALPVCELGLSYRIVELEGGNFTSVVTLQNNRELDLAHWQIVWRYSDYRSVGLLRTQGAIALSLGSSSGAPVRLVDTFTSDGVPGGGGAFSFLAEAAVGGPQPPDADQTLAIEAAAVNINGMTCSLAGSGGMAYGQCLDKEQQQLSGSKVAALEGSDEAAVAALLAGGSWGSSSGACAITAKVAGDGSGSGSGCLETASSSKSSLADEIQLHEQLGSGAFGVVYRGQWRGLPVAVKVLQTACGAASRELESFRQEARVLAQLQHPNIVCFLAACTVPPNICIVEELAEGGSLHTLLHGRPGARRRRPLPYPKLLQVATDVAEAMVYLHPRIVHRDLKSQNVLLDAAGRAKVCDFGIAKFKNNTLVSSAGGQAGTPAYMAPETFDGKRVNEKVDVYSFAILCWEMLTGRVPWRELAGHMQIIFQVGVMRQRLPLPDTCPPFLRALIEECWEEDPAARPAFPAIRQRLREEIAR